MIRRVIPVLNLVVMHAASDFLSRSFQTQRLGLPLRGGYGNHINLQIMPPPAVYVIAIVGGVAAAVAFKEVSTNLLSRRP